MPEKELVGIVAATGDNDEADVNEMKAGADDAQSSLYGKPVQEPIITMP